MKKRRKNYSNI